AGAEEAEESRERTEGEDLLPADSPPHFSQLFGGSGPLRPGREKAAVDGPDGGADDQIGFDAALIQGPDHSNLDRAPAGPAGEDECGFRSHNPFASPILELLTRADVSRPRKNSPPADANGT